MVKRKADSDSEYIDENENEDDTEPYSDESELLGELSSDSEIDYNNIINKKIVNVIDMFIKNIDKVISLNIMNILQKRKSSKEKDEDDDDYDYNNSLFTSANEKKYYNKLKSSDRKKIRIFEKDMNKLNKKDIPLKYKIIFNKKLSDNDKINIISKIIENSNDCKKYETWLNLLNKIPFGVYKKNDNKNDMSKYLNNAVNIMNNELYGQNKVKTKILEILANKENINPNLAFYGEPGVGKTQFAKILGNVLNKDVIFISLGGASRSSLLNGFSYTYEGSKPGLIIENISKVGYMNPIIFFDELDKISFNSKTQEIYSILTHIVDKSQNNKFNDKYFGNINFDLSQCLFIFSFNDINKIDRILLDRLNVIKFDNYKINDKLKITKQYIIPKIFLKFNFNLKNDIIITDDVIYKIINEYCSKCKGIRNIEKIFEDILLKINLLQYNIPVEYYNKNFKLPFELKYDIAKKFIDYTILKNDNSELLNRLYI